MLVIAIFIIPTATANADSSSSASAIPSTSLQNDQAVDTCQTATVAFSFSPGGATLTDSSGLAFFMQVQPIRFSPNVISILTVDVNIPGVTNGFEPFEWTPFWSVGPGVPNQATLSSADSPLQNIANVFIVTQPDSFGGQTPFPEVTYCSNLETLTLSD